MLKRFSFDDERLAMRLKALAHPARLKIVDLLAARGTCICGEIVNVLPLAQATVSQHLKILKNAGLLQGTIDGPRSCYCLDPTALAEVRRALDARLARVENSCCSGAQFREETRCTPPPQRSSRWSSPGTARSPRRRARGTAAPRVAAATAGST